MFRRIALSFALSALLAFSGFAQDKDTPSHDKNLDVRSPAGDLHVGADADAKKVGLPLYPGAHLDSDDQNNHQANLSLFTDAFGIKLVVANYISNDAPSKVLDFYRDKLKKYGKVLECHSHKYGADVEDHDDDKGSGQKSKELKCDEDSGPVTELKVGTEDN